MNNSQKKKQRKSHTGIVKSIYWNKPFSQNFYASSLSSSGTYGNKGTNGYHPDNIIFKNGQNTE